MRSMQGRFKVFKTERAVIGFLEAHTAHLDQVDAAGKFESSDTSRRGSIVLTMGTWAAPDFELGAEYLVDFRKPAATT